MKTLTLTALLFTSLYINAQTNQQRIILDDSPRPFFVPNQNSNEMRLIIGDKNTFFVPDGYYNYSYTKPVVIAPFDPAESRRFDSMMDNDPFILKKEKYIFNERDMDTTNYKSIFYTK